MQSGLLQISHWFLIPQNVVPDSTTITSGEPLDTGPRTTNIENQYPFITRISPIIDYTVPAFSGALWICGDTSGTGNMAIVTPSTQDLERVGRTRTWWGWIKLDRMQVSKIDLTRPHSKRTVLLFCNIYIYLYIYIYIYIYIVLWRCHLWEGSKGYFALALKRINVDEKEYTANSLSLSLLKMDRKI